MGEVSYFGKIRGIDFIILVFKYSEESYVASRRLERSKQEADNIAMK